MSLIEPLKIVCFWITRFKIKILYNVSHVVDSLEDFFGALTNSEHRAVKCLINKSGNYHVRNIYHNSL
jgi:hypothetical protein